MPENNLLNPLIVALDTNNLETAKRWVEKLLPLVPTFKVGLELLTHAGAPTVVESIHRLGGNVFFDGKFNDIPNTTAQATKALVQLKPLLFNMHASSGTEAIRQASKVKGKSLLLVVTVLTSLDENECLKIFGKPPKEKVLEFAKEAKSAGADGIVCSPQELKWVNEEPTLKNFFKVIPGIRPHWASLGDQKRVTTPYEAIVNGASWIVVGRPITQPPAEIGSPLEAAKKILEEIEKAKCDITH